MSESSNSSRSLIPSFLYSSDHRLFQSPEPATNMKQRPLISPTSSVSSNSPSFAIAAPNEKVEMFSPAYYAACTVGGMLSCGITHTAVTPLDVIKCNMQFSFLLLDKRQLQCKIDRFDDEWTITEPDFPVD